MKQRPGVGVKPYTPEELEQYHRRQLQQLADERRTAGRRSFEQLLGRAGIPPRFTKHGFTTYRPMTEGQRRAHDIAKRYAEGFHVELGKGAGLIMIGNTGTGKTHLACSIAKVIMRDGHSALFVSTLELLQIVKESYRRDSTESERQVLDRFADPDLLIMDEVGVQHRTPAERTVLTELVNRRYQLMRPMILISNLTVKELDEVLGQRIMSRMREVSDVVAIDGEDYRAKGA